MSKAQSLVAKGPNDLLSQDKTSNMPRKEGWNLVKLAYLTFIKSIKDAMFKNFEYLTNIDQFLFSYLCIYHTSAVNNETCLLGFMFTESVTFNNSGDIIIKKQCQTSVNRDDDPIGMVLVGVENQPICIPQNFSITIPSNMSVLDGKRSYFLEKAAHNNLPSGIAVNTCYVAPKARKVSIILINTTNNNMWIRQPLLAAEMYEVNIEPGNNTI